MQNASEIKKLQKKKINFYYPDKNTICISLNETTNNEDIEEITSIFEILSNRNLSPKDQLSKVNFLKN